MVSRSLAKSLARRALPAYWAVRRRARRLLAPGARRSVVFYCPEPFHFYHVEPVARELGGDSGYDVSVVTWPGFAPPPIPGVRFEDRETPTFRRLLSPADLAVYTEFRRLPWWFGTDRTAYFLHGIGPKVTYFTSERLAGFDSVFAPGPYVAEKQRAVLGRDSEVIPVGLPVLDELVSREHETETGTSEGERLRPTLLYAPSWSKDPSKVSTTPEILLALANQQCCDVVIRPHPLLMDPRRVHLPVWRRTLDEVVTGCSHVRLHHGPGTSVYSVLAEADILMSDISSVLYEYLVLDRPILLFARQEHFDFYGGHDILEATREACYCIEDPRELDTVLEMAIRSPFELREARARLLERVLFFPGESVPAMRDAIDHCVETQH